MRVEDFVEGFHILQEQSNKSLQDESDGIEDEILDTIQLSDQFRWSSTCSEIKHYVKNEEELNAASIYMA